MTNKTHQCIDVDSNEDYFLKKKMLDQDKIENLTELFKIFSSQTRIKILYLLVETEISVNDISILIDMNQSAVSHQLAILKENQLVKVRRKGKESLYSLDNSNVQKILLQTLKLK